MARLLNILTGNELCYNISMTDNDHNMLDSFAKRVDYLEELYNTSLIVGDMTTVQECLNELNDINKAIEEIESRNA